MREKPFAVFLAIFMTIFAVPSCEKFAENTSITPHHDQEEDLPPIPDSPPYAKAVVDQLEYNFGVMEMGQEDSHTFTITNKGTERDLIIKKGETTCKCTISSLAKGKLKPGESAKIELTWKPKGVSQRFEQTAEIYTSDPNNRKITLRILGRVQEALVLLPSDQWIVGSIEGKKPRKVSGTMTSAIYDAFEITEIENKSNIVTVEKIKMSKADLEKSNAKSGYQIIATVSPGEKVGKFSEEIVIRTKLIDPKTKEERLANFPVKIIGSRVGPIIFRASPGVLWNPLKMAIRLGRFKAAEGKSASLILFVSEPKDGPLKITKVTSDPKFLTVKLERLEDKNAASIPTTGKRRVRYRLTFSVPPDSPPASRERESAGTVTLETNHPQAKTIKIGVAFHSI
ncbi:MAG: DUF1573 domain-containing protein [Planctomycetaceae bacterium]